MTKLTKDAIADNLAISTVMSKQLNLYDTDSSFTDDDDKTAFTAIKSLFETSMDKNADIYRGINDQYEIHLFCISNTLGDVTEAVKTIDRFYDYKVECLDRIKSLVS